MHIEPAHRPTAGVLVVGSFPPVAGPASAAPLAAVRRAWEEGAEVVTASLRAGAADLVAPVAGPAAGWYLQRAQVAAGRPARLVLGLEPGQLRPGRAAPVAPPPAAARRLVDLALSGVAVAGIAAALGRFDQVTVLLTGPSDLPAPLRRALWRHVDAVVVAAGDEGVAEAEGVPRSKVVAVDGYLVSPAVAGVTALGPREVLGRDLPVVVAGMVGRRLLGRYFLRVRFQAIRVARRARREVDRWRG